jgi:hypothetical protein
MNFFDAHETLQGEEEPFAFGKLKRSNESSLSLFELPVPLVIVDALSPHAHAEGHSLTDESEEEYFDVDDCLQDPTSASAFPAHAYVLHLQRSLQHVYGTSTDP